MHVYTISSSRVTIFFDEYSIPLLLITPHSGDSNPCIVMITLPTNSFYSHITESLYSHLHLDCIAWWTYLQ